MFLRSQFLALNLASLLAITWAAVPPTRAYCQERDQGEAAETTEQKADDAPTEEEKTNSGQDKLDEATGLKLDADSPADLAKVIELCEEALELGLDAGGTRLAKQVLAASAFQRAEMLVQGLPRVANNPAAVRRLRRQTMADLEKAVENNPRLAEAFILIAKLEALPGGDRGNAIDSLDTAIELLKDKPVDQSGAYILRAALRESNTEKLADLRKAIEADSTNTDAWQALIALQMAIGNLQEAVDDAEKLLEKDEDNMFAIQAAVQSLLGLEKADAAIKLLSTRIAKDPKNGMFYRVRASAYRLKSYSDDLSEEEQELANDKAMADLNKALELDSRDFEALVMRGEIYYEREEIEKANRDISDSLLIEPNSVRGIMMRSMVAAQEGRYSDAIADMEMLVRANPTNVNWIMQLASYYQMDKRPRLAIKLLDRLVQVEPENWRAMRLRGDAKLSISEHVSAIEDYEQAIKILEESRAVAEDERASDIDYSGLLNNLSWVLATSPKDELRDGERALELALKACEATDYKAPHILSTLAAAYAEVDDFEQARKWAAKAVELGEEEETEQLDQLKKELESYQDNKPWREEQDTEENAKPVIAPSDTIDT